MKWFNAYSNKYIVTLLVSISIWVFAVLINTIILSVFFGLASGGFAEVAGFILLLSFVFSLPGIIIFWIVFFLNCIKDQVFKILLITACFASFISVSILIMMIDESFRSDFFLFGIFAVLAAIGSVMLHQPAIKEVLECQKLKKLSVIHTFN